MTQELDNKQKKEWAKLLFLTTDLTQAEIAVKIGVSRITIVRWAKEWEGLKLNFLQTREARIKSTLMQLNELDESIAAREQGARYPTVKEADIRRKLTAPRGARTRGLRAGHCQCVKRYSRLCPGY